MNIGDHSVQAKMNREKRDLASKSKNGIKKKEQIPSSESAKRALLVQQLRTIEDGKKRVDQLNEAIQRNSKNPVCFDCKTQFHRG